MSATVIANLKAFMQIKAYIRTTFSGEKLSPLNREL